MASLYYSFFTKELCTTNASYPKTIISFKELIFYVPKLQPKLEDRSPCQQVFIFKTRTACSLRQIQQALWKHQRHRRDTRKKQVGLTWHCPATGWICAVPLDINKISRKYKWSCSLGVRKGSLLLIWFPFSTRSCHSVCSRREMKLGYEYCCCLHSHLRDNHNNFSD